MAKPTGEETTIVSPGEVARRMQFDYTRGVKDHTTKALEAICGLCWKIHQPDCDADSIARDAAETIMKIFGIESVAIGLRDPADRLYKYKAMAGIEGAAAEGISKLAYSRDQLLDPGVYPSHEISKHTRLFLSEEHPYAEGEEFTYRRPGLIGMKRRTVTDSLEADYLDVLFDDSQGEILGFIEISGTRLRKLPDATTIRWIELIGGIISVAAQKNS